LAETLFSRVQEDQLLKILNGEDDQWCAHHPHDVIDCQSELIQSFHRAVEDLVRETKSSNANQWKWGNLHHVNFSHRPFGKVKLLAKLIDSTASTPGAMNTIDASDASWSNQGDLTQTFGASFRQIFDLAGRAQSFYILTPGQSGNIASPKYNDMVSAFTSGKLYRFAPNNGFEVGKSKVN
jgi:penicillin amidase